ncbi:ATP-binding protein [Clostridium luticellarii]|jgi:DNA replication protein DnaC|uniref:DNA replication protein DnaC n=1 Tax=Clostridium luticellarii TaxID=1691940 RepID=A0A2T0BP45_9CLOT|nr:ATP-binding protein [Clostridium luticellarii]MCI1944650.1 ATP-binding protein [Clostridium luticellarii]MCI1968149.1 ATP-binding protein [Clostridium luticellarii]MCI1994738.1 ATP-binding protein [Clostridium luticellarii]MCI2038970.1 ATP-binding protein [Clostridium luticellarii]PRR85654.1 DNA replication protein DnaC [Clostridium luticellarii]
MIKSYHSKIMKMYERAREEDEQSLNARKKEIEKKIPRVMDIQKYIGKLSLKLSIDILNNVENRDEYLRELKEKITDLKIKRSELLAANNYPIDYLEIHYQCPKCKDTGFIGHEKCSCYKQKLIKLYYSNSDLTNILSKNNFDNFNFKLYSSLKGIRNPTSPRKNIEKIASISWKYIENFSSSNENLLFYGNPGTGKTFLSNCISKELLDRGFLVVYRTSEALIEDLRNIRFKNDNELEDFLMNCDLLIIDDLGSEQITDFSKTELFNILNRKLLKQKKMLISTNCDLEELLKSYSERISSRLLGEFTLCKFFGEDIRIKQNIQNKNLK